MEDRRRRRRPLLARVIVAYLAVAILFAGILLWIIAIRQRSGLVAQVAQRATAVCLLFGRDLVTPLYRLDVEEMLARIQALRSLSDVTGVEVGDDRGRIITDGTVENPRLGKPLDGFRDLGDPERTAPLVLEEAHQIVVARGIFLGGQWLGAARVTFTLARVDGEMRDLWIRGVAVAGFLIVLGTIPLVLVTQFVIRPFFLGT